MRRRVQPDWRRARRFDWEGEAARRAGDFNDSYGPILSGLADQRAYDSLPRHAALREAVAQAPEGCAQWCLKQLARGRTSDDITAEVRRRIEERRHAALCRRIPDIDPDQARKLVADATPTRRPRTLR